MIGSWFVGAGALGLTAWSAALTVVEVRMPARRGGGPAPARPQGRGRSARIADRLRRLVREPSSAAALPEAVDAIASAVRAGRSVADGVAVAATNAPPGLGDELRSVVDVVGRGVPLTVALDRWAAASPLPGAPLVAAAVGLAGDAGGDADVALASVADTLRERRALAREIRALSSQARLSAAVIAAAPAGFAAVAVLADGDTARFLLGSRGGLACLAVGAALDLAGWRWMRRITGSVR